MEQNGFTEAHRLQWIVTGVARAGGPSVKSETGGAAGSCRGCLRSYTEGLPALATQVTIHCSQCASVNPFCSIGHYITKLSTTYSRCFRQCKRFLLTYLNRTPMSSLTTFAVVWPNPKIPLFLPPGPGRAPPPWKDHIILWDHFHLYKSFRWKI